MIPMRRSFTRALSFVCLIALVLGGAASSSPAQPSAEGRVEFVDPLALLSDFWNIEKYQPKRVAGRWLKVSA